MMGQIRHTFYKNTSKNLYYTRKESLIFVITWWCHAQMVSWKDIGTDKAMWEQHLLNTH